MTTKKPTTKTWHEVAAIRRAAFYIKLQTTCPILWRPTTGLGWMPQPSTPEAWNDVIFECSTKIEKLINDHLDEIPVEKRPYVVQVKEKFGDLRFYVEGGHDSIDEAMKAIIGEATTAVENICTKCSKDGAEVRSNFIDHPEERFGWIIALCKPCWRKESIRRAQHSSVKELRRWFYEAMIIKKADRKKEEE